MIKMSRKAKKAMAVALTAGMLASTATTPVMAANAGWKQNSTGWWYENADGTYPANKWEKINGSWYYFDANGYMVTDWKQIGGKWYYFGGANDGAMKDGWFQDATGQWCYAVPGNGAITQDGWAKDAAGNWYYLKANGYMQAGGWAKTGQKWYFLKNDGVMQTGIIDVEGEVFYLNADGDMFTGEKTIAGVNYTFDAYGKAIGEKIPTATKAFKKDGTPVAVKEEERALSVTSVTAITKNADGDFVVTALLSEAVSADTLKNTTLTLTKGSVVVTAEFVSVNNATAVYKIKNSSALTPGNSSADGAYAVTATGIDIATGLTAAYEETLVGNSVQGFVYYLDNGVYKVVKNAEIKVGNKTVKTDANGFYSIAASSGVATVEVSATGFFGKTAATNVSRNYPSTQNVELNQYDQEKLYINGTILDKDDSAPVGGVKVELQKKGTDGKYTTIATANTTASGEFGFSNSASAISAKDADDNAPDTEGFVTFAANNGNKLSKDATYQIVVSKDYKSNLYDAYNAQTIAVTLSKTDAQTNLKNVFMTAVKEISSAKVTLSWADKATVLETEDEVKVTFMDQDGTTVLGNEAAVVSVGTVEDKAMKAGAELVSVVFDEAPTLPSGTYYMVINDQEEGNAYCVIPVAVTEGQDISVNGTVQASSSAVINTVVGKIVYGTTVADAYGSSASEAFVLGKDGVKTGTAVSVDYKVYQKVNGKDVYVYTATPVDLQWGGSVESGVTGKNNITKIAAGVEYVCVPSQNYIKAGNMTIKSDSIESIVTETNRVESAANINSLDLSGANWVDADGDTITAPTAKLLSLKIVDAQGATVREVTNVDGVDFSAAVNTTTWAADKYAKLVGIPAGEYKAVIQVEGYSTVTTDAFKLLDFQSAEVKTDKTIKKDAVTTITGYVRFADTNGVVTDSETTTIDALVLLYDSNGNVVACDELGDVADEATYKIVNLDSTGNDTVTLASGTYKLVIRGKGFETVQKEVVLRANETVTYNVDVTKHIGGQAKLAVRDTNNYGYGKDTGAADIFLTDTNFVMPTQYNLYDKNGILDGLDDDADYTELLGMFVTAATVGSEVEYTTEGVLSKGTYNVYIPETDYAYAKEDTITIATIDGTSYKDIVTTAKSTGKTIPLTIQYDATKLVDASSNTINTRDIVVIEDENGTELYKAFNSMNDEEGVNESVTINVTSDATYVVKVYSEGKFVASQKVTVQGFAKTVTVALDNATRN